MRLRLEPESQAVMLRFAFLALLALSGVGLDGLYTQGTQCTRCPAFSFRINRLTTAESWKANATEEVSSFGEDCITSVLADCKCHHGYVLSKSRLECIKPTKYKCPEHSTPDLKNVVVVADGPKNFQHCICQREFTKSKTEDVCERECRDSIPIQCPAFSHRTPNVRCSDGHNTIVKACTCNFGYTMNPETEICERDCGGKFKCPSHSIATAQCPKSVKDCRCDYGRELDKFTGQCALEFDGSASGSAKALKLLKTRTCATPLDGTGTLGGKECIGVPKDPNQIRSDISYGAVPLARQRAR